MARHANCFDLIAVALLVSGQKIQSSSLSNRIRRVCIGNNEYLKDQLVKNKLFSIFSHKQTCLDFEMLKTAKNLN
jgi:hypothetical protein